MTRNDWESLLRRVVREELARIDPRALPLRSQGDQCDNEQKDEYASIKTSTPIVV